MKERDEELARSIDPDAWRKIHKDDADWCQQFADLVRADEREACAKVCEDDAWRCKKIAVATQNKKANAAALEAYLCAEAIRARSNT